MGMFCNIPCSFDYKRGSLQTLSKHKYTCTCIYTITRNWLGVMGYMQQTPCTARTISIAGLSETFFFLFGISEPIRDYKACYWPNQYHCFPDLRATINEWSCKQVHFWGVITHNSVATAQNSIFTTVNNYDTSMQIADRQSGITYLCPRMCIRIIFTVYWADVQQPSDNCLKLQGLLIYISVGGFHYWYVLWCALIAWMSNYMGSHKR